MPFFKIAATPILGVYQHSGKFTKLAQQNADLPRQDDEQVRRSINLLSPEVLKSIASVYNLSTNVNDYIFPVPRAVTADRPNSNGDRFDNGELTRFSSQHRCRVFETFRNDPLHVEHVANDPKTARGFLPDVYYLTKDPDDRHVLAVAAVDTTKDGPLAEGILSGDIDSFSMGCICDSVRCSYSKCRHVAHSEDELCEHIRHHMMGRIAGELIFEDCMGVEFQELSVVGMPADPAARTQAILRFQANKKSLEQMRRSIPLIMSLLNKDDQIEVARFFQANLGHLPDAMVRLSEQLF